MSDLPAVARTLREAREVLLATHLVADGDCLGSMLAVYLALHNREREVWAVYPEPVPQNYRFLKGWEAITPPGEVETVPPVALVLDCTGLDRVGDKTALLLEKVPLVINLDHHAGNHYFGQLNYVRPEAAATAELVFDLLQEMGCALSPEVALALYTGVVTDTGCFQYESTSPHTHRIAAQLLEAGVKPVEVYQHLWQEKPPVTLYLLREVLPTLELAGNGRVAWLTMTRAVMEKIGASQEHCEGLVEYPRSLAGVEVALFFREVSSNEVKVGFRSKRYVDVNLLASKFGGGGHRRAAGCTLHLSLAEAVPLVVQAATGALPDEAR